MAIIKTISISPEFDSLQRDHHLSWSEAARVGMSMLLADKGVKNYDNNLHIVRRMTQMRVLIEEQSTRLEELQSKYEGKKVTNMPEIEKEVKQ